jgi:iron complex outermembrane receptor protein
MRGIADTSRGVAGAAAMGLAACMYCSPGWSADADQVLPKPKDAEQDTELTEIIVTGSRIARPEFERLQPTTVLDSQFLERRAYTNVVDALDELPQFSQPDSNAAAITQSNFGLAQSFVNLFALGSRRTLTLVDGRRFVPANSPSNFGPAFSGEQVDLNVIPTQLIERVETIAVGGAPIYGSDAIAGTVNIILKRNFQGLDIDALGGISGHGDAGQSRLRIVGGKNFADDRGNIEANAEITNSQSLLANRRRSLAYDNAYQPTAPGSPYQYTLYANQRLGGITTGGIPLADDGYLNFRPNIAITNLSGQALAFNGGHLIPYNAGTPDNSGFYNLGGDGLDVSNYNTILTHQQRINAVALGHFQLDDHVRLFGESWFSEIHANYPVATNSLDFALNNSAGQVGGNLIIAANNPFLSAADQATIARNLAAYAAIPGHPAQTSQFYLSRFNVDVENGGFSANQNTKRVVLGIDGPLPVFGREFTYEVSGNYGQTVNTSTTPSLNFQNFTNALNAVIGPNGSIVCAPGYGNSPVPTESNSCAPFNPFGSGVASRAAVAYVTSLAEATSRLTQRVFNTSIAGPLLTLPAGPLKMAVGYENRHESADFDPGPFFLQGAGFSGPIVPVSGAFTTNEVFGEVLIPIVAPADAIPGVRRIELEGAIREVDHSLAGRATTWTAGLRFEPLSILQLRGSYTRAIRSPSVTELFLPNVTQGASGADPCDKTFIGFGPNPEVRAANCAKAGIAQPFDSNFYHNFGLITLDGNPGLQHEIADSKMFGFVLRPTPRMSLTSDYVSIVIEGAIQQLDPVSILDACYDNPSYPNASCGQVTRDSAGQIKLVKTTYANIGFFAYNGVVTEFDYSFDLAGSPGAWGTINLRLNHSFDNRQALSTGFNDLVVAQGNVRYSKHKGSLAVSWSKDKAYTLWQTRVIGRAVFDSTAPPNFYEFQGVGTWWIHNLTLGFQPTSHFKTQLVVNNVFNRDQPYPRPAATPTGFGGFRTYFDGTLGRYFLLSANYQF